jgi:hypothetical protein
MDIDINKQNISINVNEEKVVLEKEENKMDIYVDDNHPDMSVDDVQIIDIETGAVNVIGGTNDHNQLINRYKENQHPIKSITGLEETLNEIEQIGESLDNRLSDLEENGGEAGIYIGPEEPTESNKVVWIDTDGDYAEYALKDDVYSKEDVDQLSTILNNNINNLEQSDENLDTRLSNLEEVGGQIIEQLGGKADKNDIYTKEEVEQLASGIDERMSNLEEVGEQLIEQLEDNQELPQEEIIEDINNYDISDCDGDYIVNKQEELEEIKMIEEKEKPTVTSLFENISDKEETYSTYLVYIIRENENINTILEKYNTTKEELESYNDISNINIGTKLIIPLHEQKD